MLGLAMRCRTCGRWLWYVPYLTFKWNIVLTDSQLKGDETATLEMPPAHRLFDSKKLSPVLKQRKAAMDAQNATSSSSSSGLNTQTIAELVTILRPPVPTMAPYPYMQPQLALPSATPALDMLLSSSRSVGPSMPLKEFCSLYKIAETVRQKLDNEGYTDAHLMQYVSVAELKEAGLKNGEVASLKYAVARWSVPNE